MAEVQPTQVSSPSSKQEPIEQTKSSGVTAVDRRNIIQGLGIAAAMTAMTAASEPSMAAAPSVSDDVPAMRSPRKSLSAASLGGSPTLPPLEVIALNRIAFGPRPEDFQTFRDLGATDDERLTTYVDQQLNPNSIDDSACDAIINGYNFQTLDLPLEQIWIAYVKREGEMNMANDRMLPVKEVEKETLLKAVYSERQLEQVLADHWHNHFNIHGWDWWTGPFFAHYDRQVIRAHMLGNFRQMIEAVAQSPAMLYYLDNQSNEGGDPNENYARELFELHGLGDENYLGVRDPNDPTIVDGNGQRIGYIDEDVYGATTCFTGWRVNGDTGLFEFDDSRHFPFQKIVMGQVIPSFQGIKDGQDVLDILATHPGTARYISRKLCRRLISDNPPESVVEAAAAVFMDNLDAPDQLKKVTRTILLSPEFKTTWGAKIKRPLDFAISLLRAAKANYEPINSFFWSYEDMGQAIFGWRPPNGYPDVIQAWISTMPFLQRLRFCNSMIGWKYGGEGANKDDFRLNLEPQMPSALTKPIDIVNWWSYRILGRALPTQEFQPIVDFMAGGRNPTYELPEEDIAGRLRYMIALIFMSPSFSWR